MLSIYSYHGLGDHLICYGIVKEFAKLTDKILYYSDEMTSMKVFNNCIRLYSTIPNVELILEPVRTTIPQPHIDYPIANTGWWFEQVKPWTNNPDLPITEEDEKLRDRLYVDYCWYANAQVPFNLKWDNFYIERDLNKEKEIFYDIIGLKDGEEFIFLNEDPTRNFEQHIGNKCFKAIEPYTIDRTYINPNIRLIEFFKFPEVNLLDLTYTLERSKEIHTFATGLTIFVDLMLKQHDGLYYHHYPRPLLFWRAKYRLDWNEVTTRIDTRKDKETLNPKDLIIKYRGIFKF